MWVFLLRRLLALPPLLLVITFLTYLLLAISPGDYYQRLEEDPSIKQDYVMNLRKSVGKVVEVPPERAATVIGDFTVEGRNYGFDGEGKLLLDGEQVDPRKHQAWVKRIWLPDEDGDLYTVTELGAIYRWVGWVRGYGAWLAQAVRGELGTSYQHKASVASVIWERTGNTLSLSLVALLIAWGLAIPLGVWSGVRPNSPVDHGLGAVAYFGLSIPRVFLALLGVLFAYYSGWFPVGGMRDLINLDQMSGWEKFVDRLHHLALPASVIGFTSLASYMRQMRGQMVETMSADYVRTARAKGVSENRVVFIHALRNAINPLVTLLGFSLSALLSGSFLVEIVTNWPGLARLTVEAIFAKDEPLVLAAVLVAALMLVAGNLIADLLLALVDPRIRVH